MGNIKVTREDLAALPKDQQDAILHAMAQSEARSGGPGLTIKVLDHREAGTNGPDDKGVKGGCVSVYGNGKFPLNFYLGQLPRVVRAVPDILNAAVTNADRLTVKPGQDKEALVAECQRLSKVIGLALASEEGAADTNTGDDSAAGE